MNSYERIVLCGMISIYNATKPQPGPYNLFHAISKQLTIKGFIVTDHFDMLPQCNSEMSAWISAGRIKWKETIVKGIENAPGAFIGLFRGNNFGKMLVQVGPDTF